MVPRDAWTPPPGIDPFTPPLGKGGVGGVKNARSTQSLHPPPLPPFVRGGVIGGSYFTALKYSGEPRTAAITSSSRAPVCKALAKKATPAGSAARRR